MARKTYGKTARSIPITDALARKLARVAGVGYDVDETLERRRDPMVRALASAPSDDEPSTADEDAAAAEASPPINVKKAFPRTGCERS
jgi:hypothetical protein